MYNIYLVQKITNNKVLKVIINFFKRCNKHDIIGVSAKTAYYLLLSFFPLMLLLVSIAAGNDIAVFNYIMPYSVLDILQGIINTTPRASEMTVISLVLLFWSASTSIRALMRGVYIAHTGCIQDKVKKGRLWALLFTVFLVIGVFICVSLTFFSHFVMNGIYEHIKNINQSNLYFIQITTMVILIFLFTLSLYLMTPGDTMEIKDVYIGAAIVSVCWILVTWGFEIYMKFFNKYSVLYGTIGAFLGLALWLYIISIVLLIGAEVNGFLYEGKQSKCKHA